MWPKRATIGRQPSRCVCNLEGFFMLSRRGFLIGAGGLLTAAFVTDAAAFVSQTSSPCSFRRRKLPRPCSGMTMMTGLDADDRQVDVDCPPPPTWREFFVSKGIPHRTEREANRIWAEHSIEPEDYDEPVDEFWWETSSTLRLARPPRPTTSQKTRSRSLPFNPATNSRTWFSVRVTLPTRTADGSTQGTTSPCPCCRRG